MAEQSEFIAKLIQLLLEVGSISNDDSKEAYILIKDRLWESKRQLIRSRGLCLNCQSVEVEYGAPTKTLMIKGDNWLNSLFKNWNSPPEIRANPSGSNIKINGIAVNTIQPYLCPNCFEEIQRSIEKEAAYRAGLNNKPTISQRDNDLAIIGGKQNTTPSERYWALCRLFHQSDVIALKRMPYNDFLKTIYWNIVRNYVVDQSDGKCGICGKKKRLHVHHKTYKNHGLEHANLDDLMVLCEICHAKFHDKFDNPNN